MIRRLSRGFWIALLTVTIPIVALLYVAATHMGQGGWITTEDLALVAAYGWYAVSLVTAVVFSIWVRGKIILGLGNITLGLWAGLLIAAAIYGLSLLVTDWTIPHIHFR